MNRIWGFLFLSLSLHIFSGTVATVVAPRFALPKKVNSTVELIETTPKKKTQEEREAQTFVGKLQIPESMKIKKKVDYRYGSDEENTVLEQTRAEDTGLNANRTMQGSREKGGSDFVEGEKNIRHGQNGKAPEFGVAGLKTFGHGNEAIHSDPREGDPAVKPLILPKVGGEVFERGKSTFAHHVPDVKVGKITALNTDRFVYFGFYQRADERIYPQWENFVRAAVYTYRNQHRIFGAKEFKARYEVLLQPDGTYEKSILRESSGVPGIDVALAQSFRRAKQIPHPPTEMVKSDGLIHLHYEVTVQIDAGYYADAE